MLACLLFMYGLFPKRINVFCRLVFSKMKQFLSYIETGANDETLNTWREDMHWTLLLTGELIGPYLKSCLVSSLFFKFRKVHSLFVNCLVKIIEVIWFV